MSGVWLGKDTTDLDGFKWINTEFYTALDASPQAFDALIKRHPFDPNFVRELGIAASQDTLIKCWVSYWSFVRRCRFFYRAWIAQEVVLARNLLVVCNDTTF